MPKLTVVVPAYNESAVLAIFHERLCGVLDTLSLQCDVLYIDDGSTDDTWTIMQSLAAADGRVGASSYRATSARKSPSPRDLTMSMRMLPS